MLLLHGNLLLFQLCYAAYFAADRNMFGGLMVDLFREKSIFDWLVDDANLFSE
jgi:hypothetical protein